MQLHQKKPTYDRRVRLTERFLESLRPEEGRKVQWSDADVKGLKVVVPESGALRFEFRFVLGGRKRVMALGPHPAVSLAEARKKALAAQAAVADGRDPATKLAERRADPTFADYLRGPFLDHQRTVKKSWRDDELMVEAVLVPQLGKKRLRDVTRLDVVRVRNFVRERSDGNSPATANRHLCCLARALSLAHEWGMLDVNPAAGVERFRELARRENFLSAAETQRLDDALVALADTELAVSAGAVRLLLWTGLRRSEACELLWEDLTLDGPAPFVFLRDPKGGRARSLPVNSMAVAVLRSAAAWRRSDNPHVFPSTASVSGHVRDVRAAWERAKSAAGLPGQALRLHDLRHSFASALVQTDGTSLYEVQTLLGHATPSMTQRYAHLAPGTLRVASERAVTRVAGGAS